HRGVAQLRVPPAERRARGRHGIPRGRLRGAARRNRAERLAGADRRGRVAAQRGRAPLSGAGQHPGRPRSVSGNRPASALSLKPALLQSGMDRPRILITTSTGTAGDLRRFDAVTGRNYSEAVLAAGGLPLMVASLDPAAADDFAATADGILFSGGVDVHPSYYGQEPHRDLGRVDPDRDAFELALYRAARARSLPVLGICR